MAGPVRDKVALVTGGARGLGEATCRVLGEAGAAVVIGDIRDDLAKQVAADIESAGGRACALHMDVTDDHQVEEGIRAVLSEHGRLDALINDAGIDITLPIEEMSISQWDMVLAVNLRGPFLLCKQALPIMRKQGKGHIVNIISTAAKRAWANASAYHASKWGLLGFTHALHVEGRQHNVKVTALIAGGMRTPFLLERFPDIDVAALQEPRNVAETVLFVLTQPEQTVIPELMVLPLSETSWP
jgi:NAD(P)-dependent dehydrogenase (short-subunit alcohol dehydrogenase family)